MSDRVRALADYYADRLAWQYRDRPRARATIQLLSALASGDDILAAVREAFEVTSAVGAQLDVLGKYVGIPRNIGEAAARPYFGFWDYTNPSPQNAHGLADTTDPSVNADAVFFDYLSWGRLATDLDDEAYRFMLKMGIILNHMDGTLRSINQFLGLFFGSSVIVVDTGALELNYFVCSGIPVSLAVLANYLPKPMGVRATVAVQPSLPPYQNIIHPIPYYP